MPHNVSIIAMATIPNWIFQTKRTPKSRVNIRKFQDIAPVSSAGIDPLSDSVNGLLEKR